MASGEPIPETAEESVSELSGVGDDAPWRSVVEPDMRFHRAIIDAAGSDAAEARLRLGAVGDPALHGPAAPTTTTPAEVAEEHEELLAALRGGDPKRAEERFRVHLDEATDNLTKAWQEQTGEKVIV